MMISPTRTSNLLINQMKKYVITSLAAIVFTTGCMGPANETHRGAGLGTILGAGLGAVLGHQSGETGKGALIGGAAGALLGGAAGNARDNRAENK